MKKFITMQFLIGMIISMILSSSIVNAQITTGNTLKISPNPVENSWLNVLLPRDSTTVNSTTGYAMLYDMTGQSLKYQNFTGNYVGMDLWNYRTGRPLDAGVYMIVIQITSNKKIRLVGKFVKQ